jgi:hypothetical protein
MTPTEHLNEIDEFYGRPAATLTLAQIKFGAVLCELRRTNHNVAEAAANLGLGRACVYGLLNNFCRLTRAISSTAPKVAVAALLLVVGCATPNAGTTKAEQQLRPTGPPMPPMVQAETHKLRSHVATVESQAAAVAPQAPRLNTITLAWDKNVPGALTQVWSGPTIYNRTVWHKTNVVGSIVTLPCDQPAEFYRIRNQVGEQVSKWHDE